MYPTTSPISPATVAPAAIRSGPANAPAPVKRLPRRSVTGSSMSAIERTFSSAQSPRLTVSGAGIGSPADRPVWSLRPRPAAPTRDSKSGDSSAGGAPFPAAKRATWRASVQSIIWRPTVAANVIRDGHGGSQVPARGRARRRAGRARRLRRDQRRLWRAAHHARRDDTRSRARGPDHGPGVPPDRRRHLRALEGDRAREDRILGA